MVGRPPFVVPLGPLPEGWPAGWLAGCEDWDIAAGVPAAALAEVEASVRASPTPTGPCCWLDRATGACRYYAHRPLVCREYERGGDRCLEARAAWGPAAANAPAG
jgi:Fe-S-cluster containining protein